MTADPLQPLMDALRSVWPQADHTSLATVADQLLRGQSATLGTSTASLTFGQGNCFDHATVTIGNIANSLPQSRSSSGADATGSSSAGEDPAPPTGCDAAHHP